MIARLLRSQDFERVLRTRSRVQSPHFAVHHLAEPPQRSARPVSAELSTSVASVETLPVDESLLPPSAAPPDSLWLGAVVPKRHARRAVTRSLLKRQIRSVVAAQSAALARGLWIVRLRAPFAREQFHSAASGPLRLAARAELEHLIRSAALGPARAGRPALA